MTMPRANYSKANETAGKNEVEIIHEPCALLTHEMLLTISPDMAVVRVFGKGETAVYLGFSPERSLKIGERFIAAGLRLKPSLREQLKIIQGEGM